MINATALLEKHHQAECILDLIQKADAVIENKKSFIKNVATGGFFEKQKLFRWLAATEAARERLVKSYNNMNMGNI